MNLPVSYDLGKVRYHTVDKPLENEGRLGTSGRTPSVFSIEGNVSKP